MRTGTRECTCAFVTTLRTDDPRVLVVGFLGNRCTFDGGVMKWPTSPAHICDVIVAVPTQHDKQAVYKKGEFDDDDVTEHDMSGHDEAHTAKLVEVVLPVLMSFVATHCFVFQCASGGCVTAVSTARAMRAAGIFNFKFICRILRCSRLFFFLFLFFL